MARAGGLQGPARRAVVRWAWRLFRRDWRQQLLVLTLMTMAVAAAVAGTTLIISMSTDEDGEFGAAGALSRVDGSDQAMAQRTIQAIEHRFGDIELIAHHPVALPGSAETVDLRVQDPEDELGAPMLALRDGRYPTADGEVALTDHVATLLDTDLGETVELDRVERTVVGLVENPGRLSDEFALVAGEPIAAAESYTVLIADPDVPFDATVSRAGSDGETPPFSVTGRDDEAAVVAVSVLIITTLGMALVALIASAGFVVVAQRRQRQLGLLSAIGATGRHLRLVMVANGVLVGFVGAVVGGLAGVAIWLIAAPAAETGADHRINRLDLPWGQLGTVLAIGIVTAAIAAWWPARTISRLSVMSALSGRPPRPLPVHRSLALAVLLIAAGAGGIAIANPAGVEEPTPWLLIGGTLAIVLGIVFVTPAAVRGLARPARRLPFGPRLALRDLARFQARAAAALAAITLGLGITVMIVVVAEANEYRSDSGNLSNRQVVVLANGKRNPADLDLSEAAIRRLDEQAATVAEALGDDTTSLTLDVPVPETADASVPREPVTVARPLNSNTSRFVATAYVATPDLLAHYGIDPASIDDDIDLVTGHDYPVLELLDFSKRQEPSEPIKVRYLDLAAYTSAPTALVTQAAMERHDWVAARVGWLVESPQPLTSDQIAAAREAAADSGLEIEVRSTQDELAALRTGATIGGAALGLAIVAMAIGLIRGESTRDLQTLTATGAAPRTRRSLTATTAGALALLGVALGTAGAYLALAAGYRAELGKLTPLPAAHLAALLVGMPLAAALAGWLLAGREPRGFARQALE